MRRMTFSLAALLLVGLLATPAAAGWNPPIEYVTTYSYIPCTEDVQHPHEAQLQRRNEIQALWNGRVTKVTYTYFDGAVGDGDVVFEEKFVRTPGHETERTDPREVCALAGY